MDTKLTFLGGMGLGAAVMFFLEPSAARRRALLRDKTASVSRRAGRLSAKASRDLFNRSKGLVAEATARMREAPPTGEILVERVRAQMGRMVSDPGAIDVLATEGRVTLRGPVLASELSRLLRRVNRIRGVKAVTNELSVHEEPGSVPSLQGRRRRGISQLSPATRLLSGIAVGTVAVFAMAKRVA